jgi:hypothetical protein
MSQYGPTGREFQSKKQEVKLTKAKAEKRG